MSYMKIPTVPRMAATAVPTPGSGVPANEFFNGDWRIGSGSRIKDLPPATPNAALKHPTVFACVNNIAQDIAKAVFEVCELGANEEHIRVNDHPVNYVLQTQAAPNVAPATLRQTVQFAFGLHGNGYAHISRSGRGEVLYLDPIEGGASISRLGRERVYHFTDATETARNLLARDVLHLRFMPLDGWMGRSPISVAAEGVGIALAGQEFAGRALSGRAATRGVIEQAEGRKYNDEDDRRAYAADLRKAFNDFDNGGLPVLRPGMQFKPHQISPVDAQLLEQRQLDRSVIAGIYRMPPSKVGIFEGTQKSTVEQAAIDYVTDCLSFWAGMWCQQMSLQLLTERERRQGLFIRCDLDALIRPSIADRFGAYQTAVGGPFMAPDEARRRVGLPPITGGEAMYPPPNMTREDAGVAPEDSTEET
ncbi:MAG: phage portal protein [Pseudomonadota bacterium]